MVAYRRDDAGRYEMKEDHGKFFLKRLFDPFEWDPEKIYFYDRNEEIKRFQNILDDVRKGKPTFIMLSGSGGAGKSCFLKYLEKNMSKMDDCYPIYVRWHEQHILGLAPFLQEFCNQLLNERKFGRARKLWLRLRDSFEMTLPIFDLLGINRLAVLGASINLKKFMFTKQHSDTLEKLFITIGKALTDVYSERLPRKGILLFLVDQAEDLLIIDKGLETDALAFLLVLLRFVYANSPTNRHIVFVFAVTDRNYAEFHTRLAYNKPRGVGIDAIRIEMFSRMRARQLIEETMSIGMKRKKTGRNWSIDTDVIERIAALSHGNPAWIHEIGRSLRIKLEKALEAGVKRTPLADIDLYTALVPELIHDLIMTNLEPIKHSSTQCKILEHIARKGRATPQEMASANIQGLKDLDHGETVQQIEEILKTGFLIKIGGVGWLSVYEVPEWVRDPIIGALYQVQQDREREILTEKKIRLAKERSRLESQIESVRKLLESAEQTLAYWKEQYDRFQIKKTLIEKRHLLEREISWAEVEKREKIMEQLKALVENQETELAQIEDEIGLRSNQEKQYETTFKAAKTRRTMQETCRLIINTKTALSLLQHRRKNLLEDCKDTRKRLRKANSDLDASIRKAKETGPRLESVRRISEILNELRVTDGKIASFADVSEDIERMYESYLRLYQQLEQKAKMLEKRRKSRKDKVPQ